MDIILIAHFTSEKDEPGNCRFHYIANMLAKKNKIELITSTFSHIKKKQRVHKYINSNLYKITYLNELKYQKNISIKRLISHKKLSYELKKYLYMRKIPDVIYCAVPSLSFAFEAAKYAIDKKVKFIIDIQDLWPEAFMMIIKNSMLRNVLFRSFKKKADFIYSTADEIIAVSETYVKRALRVNKKVKKGYSIFLGTDLYYFDLFIKREKETSGKIVNLVYIGTLGHSYDIKSVIDAIAIFYKKVGKYINFVIMGDGPLEKQFRKYAKKRNVNVIFTGRLNYPKMVNKLSSCDISINPITKGAAGSVINKVGDYAAAGLPVINTQECYEYRKLLNEFNAGLNCKDGTPESIYKYLALLYINSDLRKKQGINNRKLAETQFDRKITYEKILEVITKT